MKGLTAAKIEELENNTDWFPYAEVARMIGVSRQALYDRLKRGTLKEYSDSYTCCDRVYVRVCDAVKQFPSGRPMIRPFEVKELVQVQRPEAFAVLFARNDSIYKSMGADVYDMERDALTFPGGKPVVAHPPCRSWGKVRGLAKPRTGEKDLAPWAVAQVRKFGGVLEHPKGSRLWYQSEIPFPGEFEDLAGGYTIEVDQFNFGHVAHKVTYLYICGVHPCDLPAMPEPVKGKFAGRSIMGDVVGTQVCTPYMREYTPPKLAAWLCEVAEMAGKQGKTRELTCLQLKKRNIHRVNINR